MHRTNGLTDYRANALGLGVSVILGFKSLRNSATEVEETENSDKSSMGTVRGGELQVAKLETAMLGDTFHIMLSNIQSQNSTDVHFVTYIQTWLQRHGLDIRLK